MIRRTRLLFTVPLLISAACGNDGGGEGTTFTREKLMDPTTCKQCHAEHYTEWSGSMHAYASIDPVFRAMNARGQRETGNELGDFCVKCHAPLAVQEKATTNGLNLDTVPAELQGVTCYFCHQVTDVQNTHNNPLVLANDTTMRGGIPNPVKNEAHHGAYSPLHDSNQVAESSKMCGACHDIVVPAHFSGSTTGDVALERTYSEWTASIFSKPKSAMTPTPESCSNCHMATDFDVPVAVAPGLSVPARPFRHHHEFPGVDVALTDFPANAPQNDVQRAEVQGFLDQALIVELCVGTNIGGTILVGIDNAGVGHDMPSGASQDRRLWAEVHAYSKDGTELFSTGAVPAGTAVTDLKDPNLTLFRDVTLDRNGQPAHMFWDVASIDQSAGQRQHPISATLTFDQSSPLLNKPHEIRTYKFANKVPNRVTLTLHMQAIGRDVLNDLFGTAVTDQNGADAGLVSTPDASVKRIVDAVPTFDIIPNVGDGGVTTTLEWTPGPNQGYLDVGSNDIGSCVITGSSKLFNQ